MASDSHIQGGLTDSEEIWSDPSPLDVLEGSRQMVRWNGVLIGAVSLTAAILGSVLILMQGPAIALAGVTILLACFSILLAPQVGFFVYFLLAFWRPQDVFGLSEVRMSLPVGAFTLVSTIIHIAIHRGRWFRPHPITWCVLGYGVIVAMSAVYHGGDYDRLLEMTKMVLVTLALASFINRRSWLRGLMGIITFSIGFICVEGLIRFDVMVDPHLMGPGISPAPLVDRNYFAMILAMAVPYYYYAGWAARFIPLRLIIWMLIPLTFNAVFMTLSRGGLLGLGGATLCMAWLSRYRVPAVAAGAVVMAVLFVGLAPKNLRERATTITDTNEASSRGRLDSWAAGLSMLKQNPLLGVGPSNYVDAYAGYADTDPRKAHNAFVQAAAEYGIPGLLFFIGTWVFSVIELFRIRRRARGDPQITWWASAMLCSLATYCLMAMFLSAEDFEFAFTQAGLVVCLRTVLDRSLAERDAATTEEANWTEVGV